MRQEVIDQGGHVADGYAAVLVAVGGVQVDARGVLGKQVVNQFGHVADVDEAVAAHVTALVVKYGREIARVVGAAVQAGILSIDMVGIKDCALAAAAPSFEDTKKPLSQSKAQQTSVDGPAMNSSSPSHWPMQRK